MLPKQRPRVPERWAYAYELDPPQPEPRFGKVKMLLRRARLAARRNGRLWTGEIVMEAQITHILVVTDHPDEVRAINRATVTALKRLKNDFAVRGAERMSLPRVAPPRSSARRDPSRAAAPPAAR